MRKLPKDLPPKIKGLYIDYKLVYGTADLSNAGECVITNKGAEIRIAEVLPIQLRWETWFHEWWHKIEREAGVKLKDDEDNPEADRVAAAIFADFLRNGWKLPGE